MNSLWNIERSAFRRGEYVGYCNGAQRIRRVNGGWQTYALASSAGKFMPMFGRTLAELSRKMAKLVCASNAREEV